MMTTDSPDSRWAYVALGSNLDSVFGDPKATVQSAILSLSALSVAPMRASSLWHSTPQDCPAGSPDFINAVVALRPRSDWDAGRLLQTLQAIELAYGRVPASEPNAPRPLDLDIIDFDGAHLDAEHLQLPHPRASQRLFVLLPLAEIAPGLRLAGQDRPVAELAAELLQAMPDDAGAGFTRLA